MTTILSVIGTRPEAIKMMPVLRALAQQPDLHSVVCSTGQHRELLQQTFGLLAIQPDIALAVMQPDQSLAGLTAALLTGLDEVVATVQPDWIIAQGDTTTVLVTALVAFYRRVRFAHVEAGLRTGDLLAPYPEEFNRRVADIVAAAYFAPTQHAVDSLRREGVPAAAIHLSGNTGVDAAQIVADLPFAWAASPLALTGTRDFVLVTAHRRENFGAPLARICDAVAQLAARFPQTAFIFTLHPNPNVQAVVRPRLSAIANVYLLPPLDYPLMVQAMRRAVCILTDSGGIQEEAPSFGTPLLVLRETTERPEGIAAGVAQLVGTDTERIIAATSAILAQPAAARYTLPNPYGDGHAAERIVAVLKGLG